jgi:hypothetical protein
MMPKRRPQKDANPEPVQHGVEHRLEEAAFGQSLYQSWRLSRSQADLLFHHVEANVGRLCVDCREDEDRDGHQRSGD